MKPITLLFSLLFIAFLKLAAQPTITSFAPLSGPVGTVVTITGSNFGTVLAVNKVFFGSVPAAVITGTANSLTVTVPVGAPNQCISVITLGGLSARSRLMFIPTLTPSIALSTFLTSFSVSLGVTPSESTLADMDGDGKHDIVIYKNGIRIYRNTSTTGGLSFAAVAYFSSTATPIKSLLVRDVTGDGKPDVMITYNNNWLGVWTNTSNPGSISFSTLPYGNTFSSAPITNRLEVADLDSDGRPDIVITNEGHDSITIKRNTQVGSTFDFNSYTSNEYLTPVGTQMKSLLLNDLDGDNKCDLIVLGNTSDKFSIFRNVSSVGVISFGTRIDISTGTISSTAAVGDMDNDGKLDLILASSIDSSIAIFRNLSASGTIIFAAPITIRTRSNPADIALGDINGDGRVDVVIGYDAIGPVSIIRNTSSTGNISFAAKKDIGSMANPKRVSIGDIDGDGRSDIITTNFGDSTSTVFRNDGVPTIPISNNSIGVDQIIPSGATPLPLTGTLPTGGDGATYDYQWLVSTVGANSGYIPAPGIGTNQNYIPGILTLTSWFRRLVVSHDRVDTSAPISILSGGAIISVNATYHTGCTGAVTFKATYSNAGVTPSFQWKRNGINVGVDSVNYTLTTPGVNDSIYVVMTTNTAVPYDVKSIILNANNATAPGVIIRATDSIICAGTQVFFLAFSANGGTSPSYSWKVNGVNVGANLNSFSSSILSNGDSVAVTLSGSPTTGCSSIVPVNSNYIKIIIRQATAISTQPVAITRCVGTPASFSVGAVGDGIVSYQWLKDKAIITGATASVVSLTGVSLTDSAIYSVRVTGGCGWAISSGASLTVNALTTNNTISGMTATCVNGLADPIKGSLPTGGTGTFTYLWQSSITNATSGFSNASGANTNQNYFPGVIVQPIWFRRIVSGSASCPADSSVAHSISIGSPVLNPFAGSKSLCEEFTFYNLPMNYNSTYTYNFLISPDSAVGFVPCTNCNVGHGSGLGNNYVRIGFGVGMTNGKWFKRIITAYGGCRDTSVAVFARRSDTTYYNASGYNCGPPGPGRDLINRTTLTIGSPLEVRNLISNSSLSNLIINAPLIANNVTLDINGMTLNSTLSLKGDLSGTRSLNGNGTGTLICNGTNLQHISQWGTYPSPYRMFENLIINNPAGVILLMDTLKIGGSLTMVNGNLKLANSSLKLTDTSSTIFGASDSSYIETNGSGSLIIKNIGTGGFTGPVLFPIGASTYTPLTLTNAGNIDTFSVRVQDSIYSGGLSGNRMLPTSVNKTWVVSETNAGGSNGTVSLQWNTIDQLPGFNGSSSYISYFNSLWQPFTPTAASGSNPYTQIRSGLAVFSNTAFSVASGGALPVELRYFDAKKHKQDVKISWATASEHNNDYFIIQRSNDGKTFEDIGSVKGVGTSNIVSSYQYEDVKAVSYAQKLQLGTLYYRLKQVDFDQTMAYSQIATVNMIGTQNGASVTVSPNPFADITFAYVHATEDSKSTLRITDIQGRLVAEKTVELQEGMNAIPIDELASSTYSGVYFVQLITPQESLVKRIVKSQ